MRKPYSKFRWPRSLLAPPAHPREDDRQCPGQRDRRVVAVCAEAYAAAATAAAVGQQGVRRVGTHATIGPCTSRAAPGVRGAGRSTLPAVMVDLATGRSTLAAVAIDLAAGPALAGLAASPALWRSTSPVSVDGAGIGDGGVDRRIAGVRAPRHERETADQDQGEAAEKDQ